MKKLLTLALLLITAQVNAQTPCNLFPRYDQEVFSNVDILIDIPFGSNVDYTGATQTLKMDIYQPQGDTLSVRPLIIFAHGGSFVAGDKSNSDQVNLCMAFAKRGYVTATVNYRLGIAFPIGAATATDAVYRAQQDMKAAIRFFRKDAATANQYKIDPSTVFIGGTSAGAFTALHTAYMNTYPELPSTIDTTALGPIEGNSGNPGYTTDVNAVINLCGAIGESTWIIPGDAPLCSMHGTADGTVPYGAQMLYLLGVIPIQVVNGSYAIHSYLNSSSLPGVMYTWYGAPHVPYDGNTVSAQAYLDTTLRFVSNFLYDYLGCTPSDTNPAPNTVYTTTSIHNSAATNSLFSAINPAGSEIILNGIQTEGILSIFDETGRKVRSQSLKQGNSRISIPCSDLENGLYFIHFECVNGVQMTKIMIRH